MTHQTSEDTQLSGQLAYPLMCGLLAENPTTLSYAMHTGAYRALGLPHTYSCFSTLDTKSALNSMKTLGIRGLSLTIPHKEVAMGLVDKLDNAAKRIGAINTVVNEDGKLVGYNTDWEGIVAAFEEAGEGKLSGRSVCLVGAGGAARACVFALEGLGASDITIYNRNRERADTIAKEFLVKADDLENLAEVKSYDVLINASPMGSRASGLKDKLPPINEAALTRHSLVFDMVTHETRLTKLADEKGAKVISGLRMLLFQAVAQFKHFTKREIDPAIMDKALGTELEKSGLT